MIEPPDAAVALDLALLRAQCFGDDALAADLLRLMDEQCARLGPVAMAAATRQERQAALHTLRGAAGAVGAGHLARTAADLEAALDGAEHRPAEAETARFARALAQVREAVAAVLADGSALAKAGLAA